MANLEETQGKNASAMFNGDFVLIETLSGRRLLSSDPDGAFHLLPPDVDDKALGIAVMDALDRSRVLSSEESKAFSDLKRIATAYAMRSEVLIARYEYRTKRQLFAKMMNCGIGSIGGLITLSPTVHEKLEAWGRDRDDGIEDVVVAENATPVEIGAALRLAMSRCRQGIP